MAFRAYEDHITDLLVTKGYARYTSAKVAWAITIGKMLDDPVRQITIVQTGGLASNPRWLLDYPSIQVRVRGGPNDYQITREKAEILFNLLVGQESYTAPNGDRIDHINAIGSVAWMGWDVKERPEFVFNLRLIAEPLAANVPGTNREQL